MRTGRAADGQGQAATLRWQPLAPAAWPAASPFSDKPAPAACSELELPIKRFVDGPGYYCDDYDHVAGQFKWRCNKAGAARMLVYKGGADNTTRPLLGWHANGRWSVRKSISRRVVCLLGTHWLILTGTPPWSSSTPYS